MAQGMQGVVNTLPHNGACVVRVVVQSIDSQQCENIDTHARTRAIKISMEQPHVMLEC